MSYVLYLISITGITYLLQKKRKFITARSQVDKAFITSGSNHIAYSGSKTSWIGTTAGFGTLIPIFWVEAIR
jgi:hypothetical protein